MVTTAAFEPGAAASEAVLRQDGQTLHIRVETPAETALTTYDSETPPNEWDTPNRGTRMVGFEVTAPATGPVELLVVLTPGSLASPPPLPDTVRQAPADWSAALAQ
jgi:hypothetical protein